METPKRGDSLRGEFLTLVAPACGSDDVRNSLSLRTDLKSGRFNPRSRMRERQPGNSANCDGA